MKLSLTKKELTDYVAAQLQVFFPDGGHRSQVPLKRYIDEVLDRTAFCFARVNNRYFRDAETVLFNHLNADQYAMFLYFSANTLYRNGADLTICNKLFQLNRLLHGIDAFYEVDLPDIFLFVHPLGTVLGRASYSNYLLVYQRCNVGSNHGKYPRIGEHFSLHPGSAILGDCNIGNNSKLAAGSILMDLDLAPNSLYIGTPLSYKVKQSLEKNPIWVIK